MGDEADKPIWRKTFVTSFFVTLLESFLVFVFVLMEIRWTEPLRELLRSSW